LREQLSFEEEKEDEDEEEDEDEDEEEKKKRKKKMKKKKTKMDSFSTQSLGLASPLGQCGVPSSYEERLKKSDNVNWCLRERCLLRTKTPRLLAGMKLIRLSGNILTTRVHACI
jgi:hypothetical protein